MPASAKDEATQTMRVRMVSRHYSRHGPPNQPGEQRIGGPPKSRLELSRTPECVNPAYPAEHWIPTLEGQVHHLQAADSKQRKSTQIFGLEPVR